MGYIVCVPDMGHFDVPVHVCYNVTAQGLDQEKEMCERFFLVCLEIVDPVRPNHWNRINQK